MLEDLKDLPGGRRFALSCMMGGALAMVAAILAAAFGAYKLFP